jgi:hypothetical protein
VNGRQYASMKAFVISELTRRAEDGWVTVSAVESAMSNWHDHHQNPTDGKYVIGWRDIGKALGLSAGTCQVYSSRGQFGALAPTIVRGRPAYTEAELDLLKSTLSQRKFNRKVSSPPT